MRQFRNLENVMTTAEATKNYYNFVRHRPFRSLDLYFSRILVIQQLGEFPIKYKSFFQWSKQLTVCLGRRGIFLPQNQCILSARTPSSHGNSKMFSIDACYQSWKRNNPLSVHIFSSQKLNCFRDMNYCLMAWKLTVIMKLLIVLLSLGHSTLCIAWRKENECFQITDFQVHLLYNRKNTVHVITTQLSWLHR